MATALPPDVSESAALDFLDKEVSSDLVHIFQECGVPLGLQYRLALNFKNVKRFSTYADTRGDVRTALKDDHSLEATNQATRAAVASVVSAWETSKDYASKESELRAEARMLGVNRPVTQTEKQAMRIAFEAAHGGLEEAFEPSDDYISAKLEEIENGEVTASALSEVTSRKKVRTMGIQTTVDTGGHVRIVRQRNKGVMPQHTEELRTVLRVEGNMWTMLASKFKNKPFFANMTPDIWLGYVNYLLGEKVYLMQIPAGGKGGKLDQAPLRPPWVVILNYEYELRKEAVKRAFRDSRPLRDTLREVTEDAQLKEQYFTSPIALQNRGKRSSEGWEPWEDSNKWNRGSWKGNSKGKDSDRGKKGKRGKEGKEGKEGKGKQQSSTTSRTPDGRFICFAYNGPGCDGNCGMVHCCMVKGCLGSHPTWKHWQLHHDGKTTDGKS